MDILTCVSFCLPEGSLLYLCLFIHSSSIYLVSTYYNESWAAQTKTMACLERLGWNDERWDLASRKARIWQGNAAGRDSGPSPRKEGGSSVTVGHESAEAQGPLLIRLSLLWLQTHSRCASTGSCLAGNNTYTSESGRNKPWGGLTPVLFA